MIKEIRNLKNPFEGFGQWKRAIVEHKEKEYIVTYKQFDKGSEFGIDGGRISKLSIRVGKNEICNYDRGWDFKPKTEDEKIVLKEVLENEN